jgi:hypothetical protein
LAAAQPLVDLVGSFADHGLSWFGCRIQEEVQEEEMNIDRSISEPGSRGMAICLGRTGDLLNIMPMLSQSGIRNILATHAYLPLLQSFEVTPWVWNGDMEDLAGAYESVRNSGFSPILIPQLFGLRQPQGLPPRDSSRSFVFDQYERIVPGFTRGKEFRQIWREMPLVVARRSREEEESLVLHTIGHATKPIVLVSLVGQSGAFDRHGDVISWIRRQWSDRYDIVDLSYTHAPHFCSLLALYERAAGLVTIDTATLHLARGYPSLKVFQLMRRGPDGVPQVYDDCCFYDEDYIPRLSLFLEKLLDSPSPITH